MGAPNVRSVRKFRYPLYHGMTPVFSNVLRGGKTLLATEIHFFRCTTYDGGFVACSFPSVLCQTTLKGRLSPDEPVLMARSLRVACGVSCAIGTAVPINIFHGGYQSGNAPIRVSYHGGSHYNAVIDPEEASVGQVCLPLQGVSCLVHALL